MVRVSPEVGPRRLLASPTLLRWLARTDVESWLIALVTGLLACVALRAMLQKTGGVPVAPLDDAYIHLQYARSIANGTPLVYTPGGPAVAGATSLLWPALLALGYTLGLTGHALLWEAWLLGFLALGLLAHEARHASAGFAGRMGQAGTAALVLGFGAHTWFAASGMEVVPLAWLLLRSVRRAAEWWEGADAQQKPARRNELLVIALLLPLMRPEGVLGTLLIAATLALHPRRGSRAWGGVALAGAALPSLVIWLLTGAFGTTTLQAKWLPFNPYTTPSTLFQALFAYLELLVGTLLNGEVWSALFLPRGSAPFALACLAALLLAARQRSVRARAVLLALLALGILIPGSYDCSLCNRLRYLWPFFPAWLVGAAALTELLAAQVARRAAELRAAGPLLLGGLVGALAGYLPFSIDDVAASARAIFDQQVALGLWARDQLPRSARIGVNDAGAIAYFSGLPTFDIVGLTTRGEARYWTAGVGSRFEHYERLGRARLPTHFIVYPEWFGLSALLGAELSQRYVPGATILGGERMVVHLADYTLLGSAEHPDPELGGRRRGVDRVDVADLESEAGHDYQLFDGQQRDNTVVEFADKLDGARRRRQRDSFFLDLRPGGAILLRVATEDAATLRVRLQNQLFTLPIPAAAWYEARVDLPQDITPGRALLSVEAESGVFTSLHYFSLDAPAAD